MAGRGEISGYLRKFAEKQPKHSVPRDVQEIVKDLLCCIEAAEASQEVLRAINHLLEEVRSCPFDTTSLQAKLLVMRAEAYKHLDELEKALEDCSQALTLDDADAHMYYVRGSIYNELGDWQSALADMSRAIELVSDEVYYYEQRAGVYTELREWQSALIDYTRAIELAPMLRELSVFTTDSILTQLQKHWALPDLRRSVFLGSGVVWDSSHQEK